MFKTSIWSKTVYRTLTLLFLKMCLVGLSPQLLSCFSPNNASLTFLLYFPHTQSLAPLISFSSELLFSSLSHHISFYLTFPSSFFLSFAPFLCSFPLLLLSSTPTKLSPHHTTLHYTTLHYTTPHHITLHYTPHPTTLHSSFLRSFCPH